ncbi:MAG: undecaprenyl-diphosphate phosphatase [Bacteroidia bacterium]
MSWWEILLLALVEGVTEFLPISSTGHLILVSSWLGRAHEAFVQDYEIIIQGGAILAVLVHGYRRLWQPRIYGIIAAAFIPTAVIGFLVKDFIQTLLASPWVVAINLIWGGIVLLRMDKWFGQAAGEIITLPLWRATVVGLVQSLSLLPGISRSAAALFGGRWMGLKKEEAAELSFLLAVPTLGAASAYKLYKSPIALESAQLFALLVGMGTAFLVALLSMRFLVGLWQRYGMQPFGVYRILLGGGVLAWLSFSS